MPFLIVDDEVSTRKTLRELLNRMGHKGILEASDGQEAIQILKKQGSRIRLIISDWEMPNLDGLSLASKLGELPNLDATPFLLITSDLPASELAEFENRYKRVDGHLIKPFRLGALEQALSKAHLHRCRSRTDAIFVGTRIPVDLAALLAVPSSHSILKRVVLATSQEDLQKQLTSQERGAGVVFFDPKVVTAAWSGWLKQFSKNPDREILMVCVGESATEILPLREYCKIFVKNGASKQDWKNALDRIDQRIQSSWDLELLLRKTRASLIRKQFGQALKSASEMLRLDPSNPEVLATVGEILLLQGKKKKAAEAFLRSVAENPCLPKPYIRLMELGSEVTKQERKDIAGRALAYCPNNVDVQKLAKEILGT